jgi:hypothetical protein
MLGEHGFRPVGRRAGALPPPPPAVPEPAAAAAAAASAAVVGGAEGEEAAAEDEEAEEEQEEEFPPLDVIIEDVEVLHEGAVEEEMQGYGAQDPHIGGVIEMGGENMVRGQSEAQAQVEAFLQELEEGMLQVSGRRGVGRGV